MVKYCICAGCTYSSHTGHRVHCFPNRTTNEAVFVSWVSFVQQQREDFSSESVTKNTVVCSAHFRLEDYVPGDLLESRMGFRCLDRVRLLAGAVPSIHTPTPTPGAPGSSSAGGSDAAPRRDDLPANTAPVVKTEDCEDMEERPSVTPEPAVKTPEELLNHSESVDQEYPFMMNSPNEDERETSSAVPSVQSSENGKESGQKDVPCQRVKSEDEFSTTNQSENRDIEEDEDEEFSTSLSVGDGHHLVDLGSSSEFIVDEECILQLFKSCRECNRRCTVKKRVRGLKLVVSQVCCFCESRSNWINLLDDDDGDLQINGKDTAHGQTNSAKQ
ncbi:uncharacterized protein LOC141764921 [Sebastes fasciatus]|uniref:uncharacterized protein LOC141764921 n=1 Tax=Sebastes fasciatus TaxID=394691 RepID=UPI003D9E1D8D